MKTLNITIIVLVAVLLGYHQVSSMDGNMEEKMNDKSQKTQTAVFAGGCFWCTESDFEKVDGVVEVISGYTGGHRENPTYQEVSSGGTGHIEAVQVVYDPKEVSYKELLDIFWKHVDPTDPGGQFVDRGPQYRTVIFTHSDDQRQIAEESRQTLDRSGTFDKPVLTEIIPYTAFYQAEDYHQGYYKKDPLRYANYRQNSGRDQFLTSVWKKEGEEEEKGCGVSGSDTSTCLARVRRAPAIIAGSAGSL